MGMPNMVSLEDTTWRSMDQAGTHGEGALIV